MIDYWSQYEIYTIAIACVYNAVLWFVILRVVDVMKDGGKFKDGLKSVMVIIIKKLPVNLKTGKKNNFQFWKTGIDPYEKLPESGDANTDVIEDEDEDVTQETKEIDNYFAGTDPNNKQRVVAVRGLRKVFETNEGAQQMGCTKKSGDDEEKSKGQNYHKFCNKNVLFTFNREKAESCCKKLDYGRFSRRNVRPVGPQWSW